MSQRISSRLTDWGQNDQLNLNLQFDKTKVNQTIERTNEHMVKVFDTGATAMFSFAIQTDITLTFLPNAVRKGNIVYKTTKITC
jgi:hypothetical protein